MNNLRHSVYWAVAAVIFVPVMVLVLFRTAYDVAEVGMDRFRYWAYQDRYIQLPKKPGVR